MLRADTPRAGVALLEVLLALTLLGIAGGAVATLAIDAQRLARHAHAADAEIRRASAFLDHVALWSREEFDRRLGARPQGAWQLLIERPQPTLYQVELRDAASALLLRTTLYRPSDDRAEAADARP